MRHRSAIQPAFTIAILVMAGLMACTSENPRERNSLTPDGSSPWQAMMIPEGDLMTADGGC
jgi:hypothetical protein